AELILLSIIKREPNHSEAKKTLGKLYLKTGEKDKAMGAFSNFAMGEEKKPRDIARKKFLEGDTELAIKIMEEELSSNPLLPSNYGELASYYYLTKKYEKLQKLYENSKKYKVSSPGLWSFMGLYYVETGKYEEGEKLFEDALKLNPKLPEALKGKTIVLLYKKDYGEALKYIENYTGINSKDWEGFYIKGKILKNLGNLEGAKESFLKAKELSKDEISNQLLKKEIESLK
ncbi:MAG: tetratricopeptide repeat protein, partial [Thermoanaerobaculia bacterium]